MELNLVSGYVNVNGVKIMIDKLIMIKKIQVVLKDVAIEFVYVNAEKTLFLYDDSELYLEFIKLVAGSPREVSVQLKKYENDYGVEHELWQYLLAIAFQKYGINQYDFAKKCGLDYMSDYLRSIYSPSSYIVKVEELNEAYSLLVSVLPQNIDETRRVYRKQEAESVLKEFADIAGKEFEKKEEYIFELERENGVELEKWNKSIQGLEEMQATLRCFLEEKTIDSSYAYKINAFFEFCLTYTYNRVQQLNEKELLNQYGPIGDLKKVLRDSINRLDFMELFELFKEYKEQENCLNAKARRAGIKLDDSIYKEYIDVYRLGSILISDRMNKINRNKTKNKHIPQELLDEAMIFYYDTKSVQAAYEARSDEKYSQDKESGDRGEQKVEYALKWLNDSFVRIEKKSTDRVGNSCIYIHNPAFIDEQQEYDHLIVSNKAVFNIETKNYAGKLVIDQYGNWIRKKSDEEEGIKNPIQQIRQHEKMLQSFLPKGCQIISIICIANDKAIIEGAENCPIPIVKSDMLVEFLENWDETDFEMTDLQKEQCITTIYEHMA